MTTRGGRPVLPGQGSGSEETPRRCCFVDAVGARVAGCPKAVKSTARYRRTVQCTSKEAHETCAAWLDHLRKGARFAFGARYSPSALPRHAAVKLQGGGLLGMGELLEGRAVRVRDVAALLQRALARYGSFDDVPLAPIMRRIHEFDANDR